jgi:hypothetical protein
MTVKVSLSVSGVATGQGFRVVPVMIAQYPSAAYRSSRLGARRWPFPLCFQLSQFAWAKVTRATDESTLPP